jgi:hypothetical protein
VDVVAEVEVAHTKTVGRYQVRQIPETCHPTRPPYPQPNSTRR